MTTDPTPAVRRAAEVLAFDRWPDQTVQDDPEVIEVMYAVAHEALTDAFDIEEIAALIPAPRVTDRVDEWPEDERDLYRNGFEDGRWNDFTSRGAALDDLRRRKVAESIRTKIIGEKP